MSELSDFDRELIWGQAREESFVKMAMEGRAAIITVEVKADRKARDSGNAFLEYRQKGRPSGLSTSKADYYVIEIHPDKWIMMTTAEMKRICRRVIKERPERGHVMGGFKKRQEGVLVQLNEML